MAITLKPAVDTQSSRSQRCLGANRVRRSEVFVGSFRWRKLRQATLRRTCSDSISIHERTALTRDLSLSRRKELCSAAMDEDQPSKLRGDYIAAVPSDF